MTFEFLVRAIANQYAVFPSQRPQIVEGCACCTTPQQLEALVRAPRETLTEKDLDFYAFKAMTTIGTADDFRYFWPRLVELAVADSLTTDREVLFGKPLYGNHRTWPQPEQAALLTLANALSARFAVEALDEDVVDSWLCAVGRLTETLTDFRPFLEPFTQSTDAARANLLILTERNWEDIDTHDRPANAFWSDAPNAAATFVAWFREHPQVHGARTALDQRDHELYGAAPTRSSGSSSS